MLFCTRLPNLVQIRTSAAEIWRHIHFSRWRPRPLNIQLPVSYLLMSLPSEGQSLWSKQISSTYLNWWLRFNYFRFFEKQTSAILEFYFRFWFRPLPVIYMSFCITLPNFVQIGALTAEILRHCHFSRWRPRPLNSSSGFVFLLMSLPSEGQSRSANQISSTYLN